jgi:MFS family permease
MLGVLLTQWTNSLRPANAVALRIGAFELSGNALQWTISCVGLYILLCWSQALQLRDKPAFAVFFKTPALNAVVAAAVLQTIINYGLMGWTPSYLVRHFDQSLTQVGSVFGPLTAAIGILGPLIAGPVSDFFRKFHPSGRLYVLLASMALSPLAAILVYTADSITGFYLLFVLLSILTTLWLPPVYASILDLVLPRMRGTMMSYYILITTILGLGLGPYAVGLISDITGDVGGAILNLYWVSPFIVLVTIYAIRRLPRDEASVLARARAAGEPV